MCSVANKKERKYIMATKIKNKSANCKYRATVLLPNGKTKSFFGATKKEAEKRKLEYETFELGKNSSGYDLTVGELVNQWLYGYTYKHLTESQSIRKSTFDRYESTYKTWLKDSSISYVKLSDLDSNKVSICLIDDYIMGVLTEKSWSTANKVYEELKSAFDYAHKRGIIKNKIADKLTKNKKSVKNPTVTKIYNSAEMQTIIDVSNQSYKTSGYFRNNLAFLILYYTGMRAGELLALTNFDINLKAKTININKSLKEVTERNSNSKEITKWTNEIQPPKTDNGYRQIQISDECCTAIKELQKRQHENKIVSQYLICNKEGMLVTPSAFKKTWNRMCKKANVGNKGIHALRHTFATNEIRKGTPIETLSKYLGHSSCDITSRTYCHLNNNVISLGNNQLAI